MPPESAKYLRDMLDSVRAIEEYTRNSNFESYSNARAIRDAVLWNFCVIGEALIQLKKTDDGTASKLTDHMKIMGLRNQLIHGYGVVNHRIVWDIVETKLPILKKELEGLLGS